MIKKKWLLALLTATACVAGTFGLTACDQIGGEAEHDHDWSAWSVTETPKSNAEGKATRTCNGKGDCGATTEDKEYTLPDLTSKDYTLSDNTATCTAAGTATYSYNKNGVTVSFTEESTAIGHAYGDTYTYEDGTGHWQVCANDSTHTTTKEAHDEDGTDGACSDCGYTTPAPTHGHDWSDWTLIDDNKPTAEEKGKLTRTCNGEGNCTATATLKEYELPVLTRENYTLSNDTATCTAAGTATYTYNKDGVNVSFEADSAAKGHTEEEIPAVPADCTTDGLTAGKKCSVCKVVLEEPQTVAAHHTEEEIPAVPADCTNDGSTAGKKCSVCKEILEAPETVAAHHTEETIPAVPANCFDDGLTAGKKCSVCDEIIQAQETVAAHHTPETVPAVKATCEDTGLTAGKKCGVCGEIIEAQKVTMQTGHVFGAAPTLVPTEEGAKSGTLSGRCKTCSKTVVYGYGNTVIDANESLYGSANPLSTGVNYVTQKSASPYLKYTFTEAGTYTIYWVSLNNSTFKLAPATFGAPSAGFIKTGGDLTTANIKEGFIIEGYVTSDLQYYVDQVATTAKAGEHVVLTKENLKSPTGSYQSTLGLSSLVPEKLTLTVAANTTLSFRNMTTAAGGCFLVSIGKEDVNTKPEILEEYCGVGEGDVSIKNSEFEFVPITAETAGTYTFTAAVGTFQLYVDGELYSDGDKNFFGYADFRERYLTVTLQEGNVVKVVKTSKRASERVITIKDGAVEEPEAPEYRQLGLGESDITLSTIGVANGKYENGDEKYFSFTAAEGGYYEISVAEDVSVSAAIRVDKTHTTTVFNVATMKKHSGAFKAEAGETVILMFVGNDSLEFAVNIQPCDEPKLTLETNEKLENVTFAAFETINKITVGESVAEGTYTLTFKVSSSLKRSYLYFSIGDELEIEDLYDSNAVGAHVNADLKAGANNTVGAVTRSEVVKKEDFIVNDKVDEAAYAAQVEYVDYTRTVTLKAGDVIYLATTAMVSGYVDITLTPVAE